MTHESPPPPPLSRERNRVHARNTRERKKQMMDCLQQRIEVLFEEVRAALHFHGSMTYTRTRIPTIKPVKNIL